MSCYSFAIYLFIVYPPLIAIYHIFQLLLILLSLHSSFIHSSLPLGVESCMLALRSWGRCWNNRSNCLLSCVCIPMHCSACAISCTKIIYKQDKLTISSQNGNASTQ